MSRSMSTALVAVLSMSIAAAALAQPPKPERKQIKSMLKGITLYARIDIPCKTGRHPWGTYKSPLVEVTPEGESTEGGMAVHHSYWHAESTYWGIGPNATLKFDEGEWDGPNFEAEFYGVGDWDGTDTVILFKDIHSVDDFNRAFDRAFSTQPLQDEYPDWPIEIRDAIADHRLVEGMNKRQAYIVVGAPLRFEKREEDGQTTETWWPRQDRGFEMGFWFSRSGQTGFPSKLEFVDGKLAQIGESTGSFSLDD